MKENSSVERNLLRGGGSLKTYWWSGTWLNLFSLLFMYTKKTYIHKQQKNYANNKQQNQYQQQRHIKITITTPKVASISVYYKGQLTGENGEELLLPHQLRHRDKLPVVLPNTQLSLSILNMKKKNYL